MLLDNENKNKKVHEWITEYASTGKMDIVTGYFTVGALAYISGCINDKIKEYRFVLGDIVNVDANENRALDLLNENITVDAAFRLSKVAKDAVAFLRQKNVIAKTLEPNFCHAKAYIYSDAKDDRLHYYVMGSSNLTEAGLGLKFTNNIELNIAETGDSDQFKAIVPWFNDLWKRPQAHTHKTLYDADGTKYTNPDV